MMDALAEKYVTKIEGHVPDLNDLGGADDDEDGLRDAIYDHAVDYIYDREHDREPVEKIREAAQQIAVHFCGEEEA